MRRFFQFVLTLTALFLPPLASADSTPDKAFFGPILEVLLAGDLKHASISPDGKHIVVLVRGAGFLVDSATLEVKRLSTYRKTRNGFWEYKSFAKSSFWINNECFVLDFDIRAVAMQVNSPTEVELGAKVLGLAHSEKKESPWVYAQIDEDSGAFRKINAITGEVQRVRLPLSDDPAQVVIDGKGVIRLVVTKNTSSWSKDTRRTMWYRSLGSEKYEAIAEFGVLDDGWTPIHVPANDDAIYVLSSQGRDTEAVFRFDPLKRQMMEMLAGHPKEDILAVNGIDDPQFRSVTTSGMKPQVVWFDGKWGALQKSIDAALPNRVNFLSGELDGKILVRSLADQSPATLHLYDPTSRSLMRIKFDASAKESTLGRSMEILSYTAKDGLRIPAYLTRPNDENKPHPLIVYVHGGPHARDHWGWDPELQVLASRGYAVFQPQFRGSTGFGKKFVEAGFRQWGRSMQDDITAGVEHLVATGVADPKRICIFGTSYGGYAALWGLAQTPDLYRCGVSFAGVTDIAIMLKDRSDTNSNKFAREALRWHVGEGVLSQADLDAVSPLKNVERIVAPVLLMHGDRDERVPINHAVLMRDALKKTGKTFEWLQLDDVGHGTYFLKDQLIFLEKLIKFLDKNMVVVPKTITTDGTQ